jgi:hypothetical protein
MRRGDPTLLLCSLLGPGPPRWARRLLDGVSRRVYLGSTTSTLPAGRCDSPDARHGRRGEYWGIGALGHWGCVEGFLGSWTSWAASFGFKAVTRHALPSALFARSSFPDQIVRL